MTHRILHLSDTHVTATGFDADGVDAAASLRRILSDARHLDRLDLVMVSGDIADDGSAAGYASAREIVGDFAGPFLAGAAGLVAVATVASLVTLGAAALAFLTMPQMAVAGIRGLSDRAISRAASLIEEAGSGQ